MALDFLKVSAKAYAKAKAERVYLDEGLRTIPGWPEYLIGRKGQIVRTKKSCGAVVGKALKWQFLENGYAKVSLCRNSKRKEYLVHRLVAMAFLGDPTGYDVCHCDGNKLNNDVSNLRIDTRKGNMADQIAFGKTPRGERSSTNKYKEVFVLELRNRMDAGETPLHLSKETGIPLTTLHGIRARRTWGWM
jgi:hypothetical protein